MSVATALRAQGLRCDVVLDAGKKTKWAFKYANRLGAGALVMVAEDEAARGEVVIKNLTLGEQQTVAIAEAGAALQAQFA